MREKAQVWLSNVRFDSKENRNFLARLAGGGQGSSRSGQMLAGMEAGWHQSLDRLTDLVAKG